MMCRFLTGLILFTNLVACGPKEKTKLRTRSTPPPATPNKSTPPAPTPAPTSKRASSCETAEDQSLSSEAVIQRQTIQVRMEKQRVIRRDCKGDVISDKMEKVAMPETEIELRPKSWMGFRKTLASLFNRTTCSAPGFQIENILETAMGLNLWRDIKDNAKNAFGYPRARLTVSTSPTVSYMHVRKNQDNYIDYEFVGCEIKGEDGVCKKSKTIERGTLILTVQYTENLDIGGVKEIKEDCPKEQP